MGAIASHHDFCSYMSYNSDLQQLDACLLLKSIIFVPIFVPQLHLLVSLCDYNSRKFFFPTPPRVLTCPPTGLRRLHQVEPSVLLHQPLPLPGLDQTVDHSPQRVPVQAEASPTASLHETGPLLPAAHEKCANLNDTHKKKTTLKVRSHIPRGAISEPPVLTFPRRSLMPLMKTLPLSCRRKPRSTRMQLVDSGTWRRVGVELSWKPLRTRGNARRGLTCIIPLTPVLSIRLAMFTVVPQMSY